MILLCIAFSCYRRRSAAAMLAYEPAKIINLSFAKPCPFMRHKFNRINSDIKPKFHITKLKNFIKHRCVSPMSIWCKNKLRILRFRIVWKFPVSPSNLKNLTASPGVERARKPFVYFFGTFFVQAKKVYVVFLPMGGKRARTPSAYFFGTFFVRAKKVR